MNRIKILVLCTQNSCRSQMAEGLIRARFGDRVEVFSAGAQPTEQVHPLAVEALKRRGIDISGQIPKSIDTFRDQQFDIVITTCNSARDSCPVFFGANMRIHWDMEDPAAARGTQQEMLAVFVAAADEIDSRLEELERLFEEIAKE
jgi:arsenate reductase (thioredoxin)